MRLSFSVAGGDMGAVQRGRWYSTLLLFLPFLPVAFPQSNGATVTVRLEEGMVLGCECPWQGNFSMVSWTKAPNKDPIAIFHPDYGESFSHHYRERTQFLRGSAMDGSISLRNVTHRDIGLYVCSMQTFPQGSWKKSLQVEDLDEPPEEEDDISSETRDAIEADAELVAEQHGNATVACDLRGDETASEVTLERTPRPEQPWGVVGECRKTEGGPLALNYSDRGRLSCSRDLHLSLHLTGVQPRDEGLYRCTWSADGRPRSTTVLLRVQPPGGFDLSAYMMYVYIGAGAAGLILFVVLVLVVLATKRKRRRNRVEYRVKLRSQRPVSLTFFIISSFALSLDAFAALPSLLLRSALNYKSVPLYA